MWLVNDCGLCGCGGLSWQTVFLGMADCTASLRLLWCEESSAMVIWEQLIQFKDLSEMGTKFEDLDKIKTPSFQIVQE